jgi:hypothetical protein
VDSLPFSQSCENNKAPILEVLREDFADRRQVLEIASGTGQHACHFAANMPWLTWQPTELADSLPVLRPRCVAYDGDNLLTPTALDVRDDPWPVAVPDALFSANSLHIMAWSAVEILFATLGVNAGNDELAAAAGFALQGDNALPANNRLLVWRKGI